MWLQGLAPHLEIGSRRAADSACSTAQTWGSNPRSGGAGYYWATYKAYALPLAPYQHHPRCASRLHIVLMPWLWRRRSAGETACSPSPAVVRCTSTVRCSLMVRRIPMLQCTLTLRCTGDLARPIFDLIATTWDRVRSCDWLTAARTTAACSTIACSPGCAHKAPA